MRYSLAEYLVTITIPTDLASAFGTNSISIGGEKSYLDNISAAYSTSQWSIAGDDTGGYVHNKSLNRTGTVTLSLSQVSPQISKFKTLCNLFYNSTEDYDGLTITVSDLQGNVVCTCEDCMISGIPQQSFGSTAQPQNWTMNVGTLTFN